MKKNKFASAWEQLFASEDIVKKVARDGHFDISAKELKKKTNEEPRLLTKWDSKDSVPEVFSKNNLGILSISRDSYRIDHFNLFHTLELDKCGKIISCEVPSWLKTLQPGFANRSENIVISACYAANVFHDIFGEEELLPAIYGRLASSPMSIIVDNLIKGEREIRCNLSPVQFEIDASYECPTSLGVIEAKNRRISEFNIRQLYIPWRFLSQASGKKVRPFFLMSFNDVIHIFEYRFIEPMHFNSLELVDAKRYSFSSTEINLKEIEDIVLRVKPKNIADKIFPQANIFDSVIDICEHILSAPSKGLALAETLEFVSRQGRYYGDAARFLGLAEKKTDGTYTLTNKGKNILSLSYKKRMLALARVILSNYPFRKCMEHILQSGNFPSNQEIAKWIKHSGVNISGTTPLRRASTVKGWIQWILNLINS